MTVRMFVLLFMDESKRAAVLFIASLPLPVKKRRSKSNDEKGRCSGAAGADFAFARGWRAGWGGCEGS